MLTGRISSIDPSIWQLIHGRLDVSVENVPLLGNHVEPIVFLFAPLFAVFRHPMLFVIVQNAALATMPLVGYNIAKRLGLMENVTVYCAPPSCSRRPRATSPFMSSAARSSGRALPSVNASGVGGEVDQSPLALVCRCFGLQRKHGTIAGRLLCNTMRCRTQSRLSRIASLVSLADGPGSDLVPVVRLRNHAGALAALSITASAPGLKPTVVAAANRPYCPPRFRWVILR